MPERFAIYYAPATDSPLWKLSSQWLGRDAATGVTGGTIPGLPRKRLDKLAEAASRYGFHGTLKAPMVLDTGFSRESLEATLKAFVEFKTPVPMGPLVLRPIQGFVALVPMVQSRELTDFAAKVVAEFDPFRAPMTPEERLRRTNAGLSDRQISLLDRYGYPYVMEQFQFHMTLTDRLDGATLDTVMPLARDWFAPIHGQQMTLDRLSLFHQPEADQPFVRIADFPFQTRT